MQRYFYYNHIDAENVQILTQAKKEEANRLLAINLKRSLVLHSTFFPVKENAIFIIFPKRQKAILLSCRFKKI